jgi:hypothetical protein
MMDKKSALIININNPIYLDLVFSIFFYDVIIQRIRNVIEYTHVWVKLKVI